MHRASPRAKQAPRTPHIPPPQFLPHPQALWTGAWLRTHACTEAFLPGWTYLFEAVYRDNTHVVSYPFEAPVLLAAIGPDGRELGAGSSAVLGSARDSSTATSATHGAGASAPAPATASLEAAVVVASGLPAGEGAPSRSSVLRGAAASAAALSSGDGSGTAADGSDDTGSNPLQQLARRLGVMAVPSITGTWDELHAWLAAGLHAMPCICEGCVLQQAAAGGGVGMRQKLIGDSYKSTARAARLMHPLTVWDAVRNVGVPDQAAMAARLMGLSQSLSGRDAKAGSAALLAPHPDRELRAVMEALSSQYGRVMGELQATVGYLERSGEGGVQQVRDLLDQLDGGKPLVGGRDRAALGHVLEELLSRLTTAAGDVRGGGEAGSGLAGGSRISSAGASQTGQSTDGGSSAGGASAAVALPLTRAGVPSVAPAPFSRPAPVEQQQQQPDQHVSSSVSALHTSLQHRGPAFRAALCYVLTAGPPDNNRLWDRPMLLPPGWRGSRYTSIHFGAPLLRGLVLDCIRPAFDGTLPGYQPSARFAQTYAKGWACRGPADERTRDVFAQASKASEGWLEPLEPSLGGRELARAMTVCRAWQKEVAGNEAAPLKLSEGAAAALAAAERAAAAAERAAAEAAAAAALRAQRRRMQLEQQARASARRRLRQLQLEQQAWDYSDDYDDDCHYYDGYHHFRYGSF